jgi:hypothetical protein
MGVGASASCENQRLRPPGRDEDDTVMDMAALREALRADDTEEQLHPASTVFHNEVLGRVGEEMKALVEENSRFRHLQDFVQKVDMRFLTPAVTWLTTEAQHNKIISATTHLSRGAVDVSDGQERLVIPIENASAHPISDHGVIGRISVVLAGAVIAAFPTDDRTVDMNVGEDGSVYFTLCLSEEVFITGKMDSSLSNEALVEYIHENKEFFMERFNNIPLLLVRNKRITFTPSSISIATLGEEDA